MAKKAITLALILGFLFTSSYAVQLVSNSKDWKFVLLTGQYAFLNNYTFNYFHSEKDVDLIARVLSKTDKTYIYEDNNAFFKNYAKYLRNFYQIDAYEVKFKDYKELQKEIYNKIKPKYVILVSPLEPENAIISVPIALKHKGLALFATEDILDYLDADYVIIVGKINRNIIDELDKRKIQYKEIEEGSPLLNAIQLSSEFGKTNMAYATTGDFIERSIFEKQAPIFLVGRTNYDNRLLQFLKENKINTLYLIGTDLLAVGRMIRDDSNKTIRVIVKYGVGFIGVPGKTGQIYALDVLPVNIPLPKLKIGKVIYDPNNHQLIVQIINNGEGQAYVKPVIQIKSNNKIIDSIIDDATTYIEPKKTNTLIYDISLDRYLGTNMSALLNIKYGRYRNYLNDYITDPGEIPPIERNITIMELEKLNKLNIKGPGIIQGKCIKVQIENTNNNKIYVSGFIILNNKEIPSKAIVEIDRNAKNYVYFCSNEEIEKTNKTAELILKFGTNEEILSNIQREKIEIEEQKINFALIIPISLIAILALVIILFGKRNSHKTKKFKYARVKTKRLKRIKRK